MTVSGTAAEQAKLYLREKKVPQLFEALMTGLVYNKPGDPLVFIESALSRIRAQPDTPLRWDMFVEGPPPALDVPPTKNSPGEARVRSPSRPASVMVTATRATVPTDAPIVLFMGGPGGGKTRHSVRLYEALKDQGLVYISMPDLIKAGIAKYKDRYKDWADAAEQYDRGELIANQLALALLKAEMGRHKDAKAYFLEGYPRETDQITDFENEVKPVDMALIIDYDEDILREHMVERGLTDRVIEARVAEFKNKTLPAAKYFDDRMLLYLVKPVDMALIIDYDEDILREHMVERDLTDRVIEARVAEFKNKTLPAAKYFDDRMLLYLIAGEQEDAQIFEQLKALVVSAMNRTAVPSSAALGQQQEGKKPTVVIPPLPLTHAQVAKKAVAPVVPPPVAEAKVNDKKPDTAQQPHPPPEATTTKPATSAKPAKSDGAAAIAVATTAAAGLTGATRRESAAVAATSSNASTNRDTSTVAADDKKPPTAKGAVEATPAATKTANTTDQKGSSASQNADKAAVALAAAAALHDAASKRAPPADQAASASDVAAPEGTDAAAKPAASSASKPAASAASDPKAQKETTTEQAPTSTTDTTPGTDATAASVAKKVDPLDVLNTLRSVKDAHAKPHEQNKKGTTGAKGTDESADEEDDSGVAVPIGLPNTNAPVVLVVGAPGSNKGTHCSKVAEKYEGFVYLSMGRLLREKIKLEPNEPRWIKAQEKMNSGQPVSTKLCRELLHFAIHDADKSWGYVIEGYPRTVEQAQDFEATVDRVDLVLLIDCTETYCVKSLETRAGLDAPRTDDTDAEAVRRRLSNFKHLALPMLKYFDERGKLKVVPGDEGMEEIFQDICNVIDTTLFIQDNGSGQSLESSKNSKGENQMD